MNYLKRAYLSIGSNLGNKLQNLQKTVDILNKKAGKIVACSKVYQTPSWGFKSDDFLNACLSLDTELYPQELLEVILDTEKKLGRVRSESEGYQARTIDIDILYYEDEIIDEPDLKVPHPQMQQRRFVLQPLADIAPGKIHPVLKKTTLQMLHDSKDENGLKPTDLGLNHTLKDFSNIGFIAVEGNIGAGKTTFASKIAADFNGKLVLERFADNPFLPKFYADMQRYAFPLEMSFLADRYQQFTDDTSQLDLFKNFMVSDYDIFKSLVFAKITLSKDEFILYRKIFNFMYNEVRKPDVYVYLYQNTATLLENIKKRGREYEQKITSEYLEAINQSYLDFIKTQLHLNFLIIDISNLDFVKNKADYHFIIDKIHNFIDERSLK